MSPSDFKRKQVGRWTWTLFVRERLRLTGGEFNIYVSRGGDTRDDPYRSHDLVSCWWTHGKWTRDRLHLGLRVSNGESAGVWFDVVLPAIGRFSFKVCTPRRLIEPWVLDSRSFGITLGGHYWAAFDFGFEEDSMRSYYRRKIASGEPRPDYVGRFALIRGTHWIVRRGGLRRRAFGAVEHVEETLEKGVTLVPMPEGNYPATWTRQRRSWKRRRLPTAFSKEREDVRLEIPVGIPVPGKGENSWDCEDDAIFGTSGRTLSEAIGNAVSGATRSRQQYAGPGWVPAKGWPIGEVPQ